MDTRQQLVEEWKAKLAASVPTEKDDERRFAWFRQIYTRIYRFLVSCYGEGEWRGDDDDSSLKADSQSTASRMPFVECVPPSDGLLPKSPERIRAASCIRSQQVKVSGCRADAISREDRSLCYGSQVRLRF